MDRIKNNEYYLSKIIIDIEFIIFHTKGKSLKEIEENPVLMDSIMFRLIQIAENNDKLSDDFKKANSIVPWKAIKGMRNRIVHDYGFIDISIIYDTVMNSIPELYNILKNLI